MSIAKIKFPILKDVEFLDVIKNKQTVKSFVKKDLEGIKWRDLQLKIGALFPAGSYHYALKFNNDDTLHKGVIRVISANPTEQKPETNSNLINEIDALKKQINQIGNAGGYSVDLLLSIQKSSYETQINFLNAELLRKENFINKLENQIESLNNELDDAAEQIEELKSKTGVNQYLELAQTFLQSKIGTAKKITTLKDSNPNDIPKRIIDILGAVDWSQIDQQAIDQIINYLEIFITKLPLKNSN